MNDNAGATPAQIIAYGKDFALQNNNPDAGTYAPYNHVHKKTDMDYLRLQGDRRQRHHDRQHLLHLCLCQQDPEHALRSLQTAADIAKGITETNGTIVGGVAFKNDVPGYTKQNAYRMWGNIFRVSKDFDFGWLTGQVRAGVWWENSASQRAPLRL